MNVFRNENVCLLEYLKAESKYLYYIKRVLLDNFKVEKKYLYDRKHVLPDDFKLRKKKFVLGK